MNELDASTRGSVEVTPPGSNSQGRSSLMRFTSNRQLLNSVARSLPRRDNLILLSLNDFRLEAHLFVGQRVGLPDFRVLNPDFED